KAIPRRIELFKLDEFPTHLPGIVQRGVGEEDLVEFLEFRFDTMDKDGSLLLELQEFK
uniref:Calcimedin, TB-44=44 kDa flagellar EF-HAND calcium-binding protein (Fragments) n=1 Tax=Trypanosoma brucei TaxID=5691 RepID=Q9TXG6_9TRYP